jgi:hypothetical protein
MCNIHGTAESPCKIEHILIVEWNVQLESFTTLHYMDSMSS